MDHVEGRGECERGLARAGLEEGLSQYFCRCWFRETPILYVSEVMSIYVHI